MKGTWCVVFNFSFRDHRLVAIKVLKRIELSAQNGECCRHVWTLTSGKQHCKKACNWNTHTSYHHLFVHVLKISAVSYLPQTKIPQYIYFFLRSSQLSFGFEEKIKNNLFVSRASTTHTTSVS